jgi:hypothetical protein
MRRIISLSALFIGVLFIFTSCSKYDDNPLLSLKSKAARLEGTNVLEKVYQNGQENSDLYELMSSYEITFDKDGTGSMTYQYSFFGIDYDVVNDLKWEFSSDDSKLLVKTKGEDEDESEWSDWTESTILKLTSDEFVEAKANTKYKGR